MLISAARRSAQALLIVCSPRSSTMSTEDWLKAKLCLSSSLFARRWFEVIIRTTAWSVASSTEKATTSSCEASSSASMSDSSLPQRLSKKTLYWTMTGG